MAPGTRPRNGYYIMKDPSKPLAPSVEDVCRRKLHLLYLFYLKPVPRAEDTFLFKSSKKNKLVHLVRLV